MIPISQPVLQNKAAFDASLENSFEFRYEGDQAFKNRLRIYENVTNTVVYDETLTTFSLSHILPADSLQNGSVYNAEIQVYDKDDNASAFSSKILFHCYATPTWEFVNLSPNQAVHNSTFTAELFYRQSEGELLATYRVELLSASKAVLQTSKEQFPSETLRFTFTELSDSAEYYARATGKTVNGMLLHTGDIPFTVSYIRPSLFSIVDVKNIPQLGHIKIASNIKIITGIATPDPPVYIDDARIDLTESGSSVYFSEGFSIADDFVMEIIGNRYTPYSEILNLKTSMGAILLRYMLGTFESDRRQAYFLLEVSDRTHRYITASSPFEQTDESVTLRIMKKDHLFQLFIDTSEVTAI